MELPSSATLLETVLRPSALLAAAAVLAVALRKAPARVRGAVWGIALMGSLVVPVGARWAPELELPLPSAVTSFLPGGHVNALPTSPSEPLPEIRASISGKAAIVVSRAPAADVETAGAEPLPWSAAIVVAWAFGFALAFAWPRARCECAN